MNSEKRKKTLKLLSELREQFDDSNPDFQIVINEAIEDPTKIIDEEDFFHFDGNRCISNCDGHCCYTIDMVRISPVDVDYMMKSLAFKGKTRKDVVMNYLDVFLGSKSMIPMAIIQMQPFLDITICPFSRFAKKIEVDFNQIKEIGFENICILGQEFKPTICMLYPLGRIGITNKKINEQDSIFIKMDCEATRTKKKIQVRQFIKNYKAKTLIDSIYQKKMFDIIERLKSTFKSDKLVRNILEMFLGYIFIEEGEILDKMEFIKDKIDLLIGKYKDFILLRFDLSSNFKKILGAEVNTEDRDG